MSRRSQQYVVMFALWLQVFSVGSQAIIIAPIIPRMAEQLLVSEALLGTLITSYTVAVGVFSLLAGPVSDRVGRREILLVGAGIMTVGLALHGLASSFASLFVVRGITGIGGGVLNGAAVAYVGDYFPPERRGWANGWIFSGFSAGAIVGIPLGTILATQFGFRWPFLAFAITMGLAFVLIWIAVPQPDVGRTESALTIRNALNGYASLLGRRDIAAASVVFLTMFGANSLYITFLPAWLETELGVTGTAVAGIFFFGGIATVIAGPQAGKLSDRVGRKPIIIAASLGIALLMTITSLVAVTIIAVYVLFVFVMGLFASRGTPFQTLLTELVESDQRGSLMSLTTGVGQVGSGLGGVLAASLYATAGYPTTTVIAATGMILVAGLVWYFLPETAGGVRPPATDQTDRHSVPARSSLPNPSQSRSKEISSKVVNYACQLQQDALYGPCAEGGHTSEKQEIMNPEEPR